MEKFNESDERNEIGCQSDASETNTEPSEEAREIDSKELEQSTEREGTAQQNETTVDAQQEKQNNDLDGRISENPNSEPENDHHNQPEETRVDEHDNSDKDVSSIHESDQNSSILEDDSELRIEHNPDETTEKPGNDGSAYDNLRDYYYAHNYSKGDFNEYSKDPDWRELNNAYLQELDREPIDYSEEDPNATHAEDLKKEWIARGVPEDSPELAAMVENEQSYSPKPVEETSSYDDSARELPEFFRDLPEDKKEKQLDALSKMTDDERKQYLDVVNKEPEITEDVKDITDKNGGKLEGLDYRVKTPSSTYEKMYDREKPTDINDMNDIIRYTETYPPDQLADGTNASLSDYESRGYTVDKVRNTWDDEGTTYRGINTNLTSPDGQTFEVQFHTPESFDLKNGDLHKMYEERRTLPDDHPRAIELDDNMRELSSRLERPSNIDKVMNR